MSKRIAVGQTVYIERGGYNRMPRRIEERVVRKVGKMYFYLEGMDDRYKFSIAGPKGYIFKSQPGK